MRFMTIESAEFSLVFGVDMAAIGALDVGDTATVAAGFGRVPPGGETALGRHDEAEALVVVSGRGEVIADNRARPAGPGTVVLFEPFERHVLRNDGNEDLRFVYLYWRNSARTAQAARRTGHERFADRPVFVFSTPVPAGGGAGPAEPFAPPLGADAFVRFQRMNGVEAYHLTGSDDHPTRLARHAREVGSTPAAVAAHHAAKTRSVLERMDIPPDQFTVPAIDPTFARGLNAFFARLGPSMSAAEPSACHAIPLHAFADAVRDHQRRGKISPRLRRLAGQVFDRAPVHVPLARPSPQGRPVAGARVATAYGILHAIAALGQRLGRDWSVDHPRDEWKIVHFMGWNTVLHNTILCPALYKLAYPGWAADIDYNAEERDPADDPRPIPPYPAPATIEDVLTPETVDAVRYYLALAHVGTARSSFDFTAFRRKVAEILIGRWQAWLDDLGTRTRRHFGGRAPDTGSWTPGQSAFLGRLQTRLGVVAVQYGADGFALDGVVRELNGLVDDAIRFAAEHRPLAREPSLHDEWRTAVALELAAARLLASCAAPIMPRFAEKLAGALGAAAPTEWPEEVSLVPAGTRVDLDLAVFFSVASLARPRRNTERAQEPIAASA